METYKKELEEKDEVLYFYPCFILHSSTYQTKICKGFSEEGIGEGFNNFYTDHLLSQYLHQGSLIHLKTLSLASNWHFYSWYRFEPHTDCHRSSRLFGWADIHICCVLSLLSRETESSATSFNQLKAFVQIPMIFHSPNNSRSYKQDKTSLFAFP